MLGFLYGQTEYNLLKNSMHLKDYVLKAKEYGYKVLSIADSNLYGMYKFYSLCVENDIKPLIGMEIKSDYTLLAYALNDEGYRSLCRISTEININKTASMEFLSTYKAGLYFVTTSDISLDEYRNIKGYLNNVGIGVFSGDTNLYEMAISNNISVYPLLKTSYLTENDFDVYEAICLIGKNDKDPKATYLLNEDELSSSFSNMPKVFDALDKLIEYTKLDVSIKRAGLPKYPLTGDKTSKEYLYNLCMAGLKKRLSNYTGDTRAYIERLKYELDVIDKMGYNDYFLIVWDFIKYAKNNKILVGPGRGSAAGSLVSYSIGISSVDPIKYGLYFERFLNPERITMPDIDTDFPDIWREDVIKYVSDLYGSDHVCIVGAFGTFKIKSSIAYLGKAYNKGDEFIKAVSAQIKAFEGESIKDLIEKIDDKEIKSFLTLASKLEDIPNVTKTHPSGVIVSDVLLPDIIPLQESSSICMQTTLEAGECEELGLLKMDFLGLINLTIIDNVIKQIPNLNNINVFNSIPLDDEKVYRMLSDGDTLGIFQLERPGITRTVMDLKPGRFEDLVALLALYRPGPMKNIPEFIERRNGKRVEYIHNDLKPILEETYGIIVYQEQIMQIARKFAGYSLGEADVLRRAVSKKKESVLVEERERFVKSSIARGYSSDIANKIYDDIVLFADYGFNKSHTVAYGLFAYTMAYLKCNYKELFMVSLLNSVMGSSLDTKKYIEYAKRSGISVMPPHINISTNEYIYTNGKIYMPLNSAKEIVKSMVSLISGERENGEFKSLDDFKSRVDISQSAIRNLIYAGAFDSLSKTKKGLIDGLTSESVFDEFLGKKKESNDEYDDLTLTKLEKESLGFNLTYDSFRGIDNLRIKNKAVKLSSLKLNQPASVIALFNDTKELTTKNNTKMLIGHIEDENSEYPIVIFPSEYDRLKRVITRNKLYLLDCVLKPNKEKGVQIVIDDIKKA